MTTVAVSAQPLIDAIKAALTARGVAFGDGDKPTTSGTKPWIWASIDAGAVENRSLIGRDGFSVVGVFHCVGLTPESARVAVRALRGALLDLHLAVVDGRTVQMPEQLSSQPLSRDDDAIPPVWDAIDEWRIRTTPA